MDAQSGSPLRSAPKVQPFSRGRLGKLDVEAAARVAAASGDIALVIDRDGVIRDMAVSNNDLALAGVGDAEMRVASVVNMGNPHAIVWVRDLAAHDLAAAGPLLERHPMFPAKANISLAEILARDHIRLRVWERGVGLTQACGSAACAALVAAVRDGLTDRKARVTLPGGDLTIEWREADDHVLMTGPVELESETTIAL